MLVQLAGFNFTVTDLVTGLPIEGALCIIYADPNMSGDADGVLTDTLGQAGIDAQWFAPDSWSVSKEGYITQWSNYMYSQITVALEPTEIIYSVNVLAGGGGYTVPSGFLDVLPNTELLVTAYPDAGYILDYWVYKGQNVGSGNPLIFLIDRDAITIVAVFKVVEEPPPNGEPPTNGYVRTYAFFSNYSLKAESWERGWIGKTESASTGTPMPISAKLRYEVLYLDGTWNVNRVRIRYNGDVIWEDDITKGTMVSGEIDVTGQTKSTDSVRIDLLTYLGEWDEVQFSVWVDYTFAEEPIENPSETETPPWADFEWYQWLALGGGALLLVSLLVGRQPKVIVVKG